MANETKLKPGDWERVAQSPEFRKLMASKARFVIPATVFFIVYYFALPVLVGYAPKLMSTPVLGVINVAYAFALSQFFVAWFIAFLYMRAANRFDEQAKSIVTKLEQDR
jgi:uncharacterized membrane protein (DUF485 family)